MGIFHDIALYFIGLVTLSGGMFGGGPGTINQLSPFQIFGSEVRLASSTADFRVPSLASLDCIGTDSDGVLGAGTCTGEGGGGSGTVTQISTNFPILGGPITTTGTLTFGGLSTSSNLTIGRIPYVTGANTFADVSTTTLTASSPLSLSQPVAKIGGSNSSLSLDTSGSWTGNAGTATALANNGANCSAGNYPLGIDASGAVESCTADANTTYTAGDALTLTGTDFDFDGLSVNGAEGTPAYSFASDTGTGMFRVSGGILGFSIAGTGHAALNSTNFYPYTNDATALGIATNGWSDLFLASGAVVGFGNGDVSLTHSSGKLTLSSTDNLTLSYASTTAVTTSGLSSTTDLIVSNNLTFNGVTSATWAAFCTAITGSSELCDGDDATGGAGATPGGDDTQVQFNNGGSFGGDYRFAWSPLTTDLTLTNDTDGTATTTLTAFGINTESPGAWFELQTAQSDGSLTAGGIYLAPGYGSGSFDGGTIQLQAGAGGEDVGAGGQILITAGDGGFNSGAGGSISLTAGSAQAGDSDGGDVTISTGALAGSGSSGSINIFTVNGEGSVTLGDGFLSINEPNGTLDFNGTSRFDSDGGGNDFAILSTSPLTADRTFSFPDASGTLCLTATCASLGYPFPGNATSTLLTFSGGLTASAGTVDLSGATVKQHTYSSFSYSTSTAWTGTTTIPLGPAYTAETWSGVKCFTDTGTLQVSFNDGTNRMNWLNASTTVGTIVLSSNNTFTAGEKRYVDIGTPASSPTKIACTVDKIVHN